MSKVLIVDPNSDFLNSLNEGLKQYQSQFEVLAVSDGQAAVEVLKREPVSLLVTDLGTPKIDGLALLAHMTRNYSKVPCVVMTRYETPQIKKRTSPEDNPRYLEKPFHFQELANAIIEGLDFYDEGKGLRGGLSVSGFLSLIEMEEKTCLLEIHSGEKRKGLLFFDNGVLYDAIYGDLNGDDAALEMIPLENVTFSFKDLPQKKIRRRIKTALTDLITEAMKLGDETKAAREGIPPESEQMEDSLLIFDDESGLKGREVLNAPSGERKVEAATENINIIEGDKLMALEKFLEELQSIKGYKASAVMNFTGEILASDSTDPNIDLAVVGATFNDIFRSAHEASKKIGLEACKKTTIETPKGLIVMECSGVDATVHFHVIGILSADGNQALMKMQFDKMIPQVMEELA